MKTTIKVKMSKEAEHYLKKIEMQLEQNLGKEKAHTARLYIEMPWCTEWLNTDQVQTIITWSMAQVSILHGMDLISVAAEDGMKKELWKIREQLNEFCEVIE